MRRELGATAAAAPGTAIDAHGSAWPWSKLKHLTLGPFRGFRAPEPFDLTKQITLFYGPNGSGKTSLCEGLEYALLGDVEEAGSKRIAARTYLTNIHDGRFASPVLKATDQQGREVDVTPNPDTYRFCFVEKNRIDAFSRIAARPSAQRTELIATLFGMDQFNEFVGHFNESIDAQLVLVGERQSTLAARRLALAADRLLVEGAATARTTLSTEEASLAQAYAPGTTYESLKALMGLPEAPGRLQELEACLDAVPPVILGITREEILQGLESVHTGGNELDRITTELHARSDQVSFKALYGSVLALRAAAGERCPACDTPLAGLPGVVTDPYQKATAGLKQLEELGMLQEQQRAAEAALGAASRALRHSIVRIGAYLASYPGLEPVLGEWIATLPPEPTGRWWSALDPAAAAPLEGSEASLLESLLSTADQMATQDRLSRQAQQDRLKQAAERRRLSEFQLRVRDQDQKRRELDFMIKTAADRIETFDQANAALIQQADQEQLDIARDGPLKAAYDRFLEELRTYKNQLPARLLAGLNDAAKDFYNAFNRNDRNEDKLDALHLPLTGDGRIEISFRGNRAARVDALQVLSEGHVRCLGLAILLAKARSIECPVIVFDDAINAIDHDHRGGIRETIFESDRFAHTQLIVTCHSNEFIKDIQQHLPAQRRNACQVYLLRHHSGDYRPRVAGNVPSANYIAKARAAREVLNDREALAACRQALEMLSEKTWRWMASHDQGLLNLLIAGVGAEPALRNLCEALIKKLREAQTFDHVNKATLVSMYGTILGIPATNLVWVYLNKGTHEEAERDDFDGELVESVVLTLETLDRLDLRPGH